MPAAAHTAQQIEALDSAFTAYLGAIDGGDEFAKAQAIIRLDNIEMDLGARANADRYAFARRILAKAGRW